MLSAGGKVQEVFAESEEAPVYAECGEPQRIANMESNFLRFGDDILGNMDEYVSDPEMRAKIKNVFALVRQNPSNPKCTTHDVSPPAVPAEGSFIYRFFKSLPYSMSFAFRTRAIRILSSIKEDDVLISAFLVHELAHVEQDDRLRKSVSKQRYEAVLGSGGGFIFIPEDEADGIARSIEALNVHMRGSLKRNILAGRHVRIDTIYPERAAAFLKFAEHYYRDPNGFVKFVEKRYMQEGGMELLNPDLTPRQVYL
jgi:hypothetical protein